MQDRSPDHAPGRDRTGLLVLGLVAAIVACWLLAMPRSAGPDEPSHLVRSAALVRGQLDGEPYFKFDNPRAFELPAHVGFPDPGCFAFNEFQAANCVEALEDPSGETLRGTRSSDYPVWGHLLPGLGSFAPAEASTWLSRLLDALIPVLLVAGALVVAARRGWMAVGSVVLAVTPMAWFMFATVNPSGLAIAGGVGLWIALLASPRRNEAAADPGIEAAADPGIEAAAGPGIEAAAGPVVPHDRLLDVLLAVSFAALVLPRRDGMIWASVLVGLALLLSGDRLLDPWRRSGLATRIVVVLSTCATLAWAATSSTSSSMALFLAPLMPVLAVGLRAAWRWVVARGPLVAGGAIAAAVVLTPLALIVVMNTRAGGFDRVVFREVVSRTGDDLVEAIGLLGWLDTEIPTTARFLWLIGLGILVGAAVVAGERALLVTAAAVVGVAIVGSWVLTMLQNDDTGTYWQGRYYLPLLVGLPIVLGRTRLPADQAARAGRTVAGIGLVVGIAALGAATRRFGVGNAGSMLPWDWGTYDTVLPVVVLLALVAVASVLLHRALDRLITLTHEGAR